MAELTDATLEAMLKAYCHDSSGRKWTKMARDNMRAAADVLVPVLLAEALKEPDDTEILRSYSTDLLITVWFDADFARVRRVFRNRLADMTAPSDPRIKEVLAILERSSCSSAEGSQKLAQELLALADKWRVAK